MYIIKFLFSNLIGQETVQQCYWHNEHISEVLGLVTALILHRLSVDAVTLLRQEVAARDRLLKMYH